MWIPEAPTHRGVYAHKNYGLGLAFGQNCTCLIKEAKTFEDKESCEVWCKENPHPVFVPVQHAFGEVLPS